MRDVDVRSKLVFRKSEAEICPETVVCLRER